MKTEGKKHYPIRRAKKPKGDPPSTQTSVRRSPSDDEQEETLGELPRRERRALSHVGGEVYFQGGSDEVRAALLNALDVSADEQQVMADVHGFHSYPARLHPRTARALIEAFTKPGARVLDPFCGSGTVVVEGRALGREAIGSDLNPLAVELSWLKSRGPTPKLVGDMVRAAKSIAEVAEERRLAKADSYRRYSDEDRERYPIHILLELDSLAHGISQVPGNEVKRMLRLVISSMLTKLSHSEGDTTRRKSPRRLPAGFAIRLFQEKASELAERFADYRKRLADKAPRAYVAMADARDLEKVESDSIDLIVTSPPYPGVYDYLDHHMHRIEWLGLRPGLLVTDEIGARRKYRRLRLDEAAAEWRSEIGPTLYELRRTLADDGCGVIVVADSVIDRRALRADEQIRLVAERAGIDITCIASQERPIFLYGAEEAFADAPRLEHVVVFRPAPRKDKRAKKDPAADLDRPEERVRPQRFREFDRERMLREDAERARQAPEGTPRGFERREPGRTGPDRGGAKSNFRQGRDSGARPGPRPNSNETKGRTFRNKRDRD